MRSLVQLLDKSICHDLADIESNGFFVGEDFN